MAINDNTAKWKVRKLTNLQVGSNGYWQPNEEVKVGTIRFPQGNENVGYILECVEAGTTGEEQPTLIGEELANYAEVGRVGQVRVIFNLAEKDVDEVMAMGITYSRLTYPELWDWAGKRAGLIISEEEWQAKFAETNGKFVPYYSSGDGSSTFRTPLLGAYLKGAETSSEVGKWLDAGLPNIEGDVHFQRFNYNSVDIAAAVGAFTKVESSRGSNKFSYDISESNETSERLEFDASRSNSIYGNSDTVTPETMTGIWVIKAVGVVVDSGETDIAKVLTATEQVQERVSVVEDELPKKANLGALSMPSGNKIQISTTSNYIVPADGYIRMGVQATQSGTVAAQMATNSGTSIAGGEFYAYSTDLDKALFMPVSKGEIVWFYFNGTKMIDGCFIYAQSEV